MEERFETCGSTPTIRGSRLAHDVEQLFGDDLDLDPLFFEESWTVGKSVALENLRRRRQWQLERERQSRAVLEVEDLEVLLADRAAAVDSGRNASQAWRASHAAALYGNDDSSESWTPQDWVPLDRVIQSWIPEGWMPEEVRPKDEILQQPEPRIERTEHSMSVCRALQILETTSTSTREEVRSAYRRRVTECHPDRLPHATEAVRLRATQELAAVNEAYHVLCSAMLQAA
jgi:hypothetical protein